MKRSNSAPMIPDLTSDRLKPLAPSSSSTSSSLATLSQGAPVVGVGAASLQSRRGLSTSNISLPGDFTRPEGSPRKPPLSSPIPITRISSPTSRQHRVVQLKREEAMDERREEREVQQCIRLSQSWEELKLDTEDFRTELMEVCPPPPSSTLQSFVPPLSPLSRMRSRSLTPTSPVSTRVLRRSCSPILRPSTLGLGNKRKRDEQEEMDTSPVLPGAKRIQCIFTNTPSPSVSPLRGNSPLHHSFSTSRKSSSQSESTPLSSPSSSYVSTNPFAVNYDSGNLEHWHSGGSTGSSTAHSPPGTAPLRFDGRLSFSDEGRITSALHLHVPSTGVGLATPGIVIEDHRAVTPESSALGDTCGGETPTPLSPKGLQFHYRPFAPSSASLPSPIPRLAQGSVGTGVLLKPSPGLAPPKHLPHDKSLSSFNSGPTSEHSGQNHAHSHTHPHGGRGSWVKSRSQLLTSSLRTHQYQAAALRSEHRGGVASVPGVSRSSFCSSPLSKLSLSAGLDEGVGGGGGDEELARGQPRRRQSASRRLRHTSETSTESHEDSMMESDSCSLTSSLEASLDIIDGSGKELDSKVVMVTP